MAPSAPAVGSRRNAMLVETSSMVLATIFVFAFASCGIGAHPYSDDFHEDSATLFPIFRGSWGQPDRSGRTMPIIAPNPFNDMALGCIRGLVSSLGQHDKDMYILDSVLASDRIRIEPCAKELSEGEWIAQAAKHWPPWGSKKANKTKIYECVDNRDNRPEDILSNFVRCLSLSNETCCGNLFDIRPVALDPPGYMPAYPAPPRPGTQPQKLQPPPIMDDPLLELQRQLLSMDAATTTQKPSSAINSSSSLPPQNASKETSSSSAPGFSTRTHQSTSQPKLSIIQKKYQDHILDDILQTVQRLGAEEKQRQVLSIPPPDSILAKPVNMQSPTLEMGSHSKPYPDPLAHILGPVMPLNQQLWPGSNNPPELQRKKHKKNKGAKGVQLLSRLKSMLKHLPQKMAELSRAPAPSSNHSQILNSSDAEQFGNMSNEDVAEVTRAAEALLNLLETDFAACGSGEARTRVKECLTKADMRKGTAEATTNVSAFLGDRLRDCQEYLGNCTQPAIANELTNKLVPVLMSVGDHNATDDIGLARIPTSDFEGNINAALELPFGPLGIPMPIVEPTNETPSPLNNVEAHELQIPADHFMVFAPGRQFQDRPMTLEDLEKMDLKGDSEDNQADMAPPPLLEPSVEMPKLLQNLMLSFPFEFHPALFSGQQLGSLQEKGKLKALQSLDETHGVFRKEPISSTTQRQDQSKESHSSANFTEGKGTGENACLNGSAGRPAQAALIGSEKELEPAPIVTPPRTESKQQSAQPQVPTTKTSLRAEVKASLPNQSITRGFTDETIEELFKKIESFRESTKTRLKAELALAMHRVLSKTGKGGGLNSSMPSNGTSHDGESTVSTSPDPDALDSLEKKSSVQSKALRLLKDLSGKLSDTSEAKKNDLSRIYDELKAMKREESLSKPDNINVTETLSNFEQRAFPGTVPDHSMQNARGGKSRNSLPINEDIGNIPNVSELVEGSASRSLLEQDTSAAGNRGSVAKDADPVRANDVEKLLNNQFSDDIEEEPTRIVTLIEYITEDDDVTELPVKSKRVEVQNGEVQPGARVSLEVMAKEVADERFVDPKPAQPEIQATVAPAAKNVFQDAMMTRKVGALGETLNEVLRVPYDKAMEANLGRSPYGTVKHFSGNSRQKSRSDDASADTKQLTQVREEGWPVHIDSPVQQRPAGEKAHAVPPEIRVRKFSKPLDDGNSPLRAVAEITHRLKVLDKRRKQVYRSRNSGVRVTVVRNVETFTQPTSVSNLPEYSVPKGSRSHSTFVEPGFPEEVEINVKLEPEDSQDVANELNQLYDQGRGFSGPFASQGPPQRDNPVPPDELCDENPSDQQGTESIPGNKPRASRDTGAGFVDDASTSDAEPRSPQSEVPTISTPAETNLIFHTRRPRYEAPAAASEPEYHPGPVIAEVDAAVAECVREGYPVNFGGEISNPRYKRSNGLGNKVRDRLRVSLRSDGMLHRKKRHTSEKIFRSDDGWRNESVGLPVSEPPTLDSGLGNSTHNKTRRSRKNFQDSIKKLGLKIPTLWAFRDKGSNRSKLLAATTQERALNFSSVDEISTETSTLTDAAQKLMTTTNNSSMIATATDGTTTPADVSNSTLPIEPFPITNAGNATTDISVTIPSSVNETESAAKPASTGNQVQTTSSATTSDAKSELQTKIFADSTVAVAERNVTTSLTSSSTATNMLSPSASQQTSTDASSNTSFTGITFGPANATLPATAAVTFSTVRGQQGSNTTTENHQISSTKTDFE